MLPFDANPLLGPGRPTFVAGAPQFVSEYDYLVFSFGSLVSGATAVLSYRMLGPDGQVSVGTLTIVIVNNNGVYTVQRAQLRTGWLLGVHVRLTAGDNGFGAHYAKVELAGGPTSTAPILQQLVAGWPTYDMGLSWPHVEHGKPPDAIWYAVRAQGTDPAAGVEILEGPPPRSRWKLKSFAATLVCDATVVNRRPCLHLYVTSRIYFRSPIPADITASQTRTCVWAVGMPLGVALGALDYVAGLPEDLWLSPDDIISTVTSGLQAGDNWGPPFFLFEAQVNPTQ